MVTWKNFAGCPTTPVRSLNTTQESTDINFQETEMVSTVSWNFLNTVCPACSPVNIYWSLTSSCFLHGFVLLYLLLQYEWISAMAYFYVMFYFFIDMTASLFTFLPLLSRVAVYLYWVSGFLWSMTSKRIWYSLMGYSRLICYWSMRIGTFYSKNIWCSVKEF